MAQGAPKPGEKYRHFKNKFYQIITMAKHSETGEDLVIYQALYGDFDTYARPLSMFISDVERKKYPDARQRFRFQLMEEPLSEMSDSVSASYTNPREAGLDHRKTPAAHGEQRAQHEVRGAVREAAVQDTDRDGQKSITELLMEFYDAKTYEDKYLILNEMRGQVTDTMINNMAVVLDIVIPEGDLEVRYEELRRCLRTYQRYETSRLH